MQPHHPAVDAWSEQRNVQRHDRQAQRQHPDAEHRQEPQQATEDKEDAYQRADTWPEMIMRPPQQPKSDFGDALFCVHETINVTSVIEPSVQFMSDHFRCFAGTGCRVLTTLQ